MKVAILLFDGITALDAIGPYEVLAGVPGTQVQFVAEGGEGGRTVATEDGALSLTAGHGFADADAPDVVLIPGGSGTRAAMTNEPTLDWVRGASAGAKWTTSVCTGSLVLGAAGLLEGRRATSHWLYLERLRELGAEPTGERVVIDGNVITAAGVSAGIDMALRLVAMEFGDDLAQAVQLAIEYDPQPPFDSGSPEKAPAHVVEAVRAFATKWDVAAERREAPA